MRAVGIFVLACILAAAVPFVRATSKPRNIDDSFPGWPASFEGRPLVPLPLTAGELRFEREFAGRIARFTDGQREIALRWVTEPTRSLHPAADCLKATGYDVRPQPIMVDHDGRQWGVLSATRNGRTMQVRERIYDSADHTWTDVSAWYWSALLGGSGPWWAVTIAESEP
jgi:HAMP domain-containing protein